MTRALAALALLAVSCGGGQVAPTPAGWLRVELETPVTGLSGLTQDETGALWAIAERDRRLLRVGPGGVATALSIDGVPDGVDTEAVVALGEGRFAIGTESQDADRDRDWVLLARREGSRLRVEDRVALPYDALHAEVGDNDGIEGLCAHGERLVAAIEHVQEEDGERHAALAVRGEGGWRGFRVRLTSDVGKLSALSCRTEGGREVVYAVERGLGPRALLGERRWVTRIVAFTESALAEPEVVLDLSERMPDRPNVEGLAVDDDFVWLVVDNHYGRVTGPSLLFRIPRPGR